MGDFIEVARLDEVPPGKGTVVTVAQGRGGVHVDGTIYAMENSCRHQGLSLGTSKLDGKVVTCGGRMAVRRDN